MYSNVTTPFTPFSTIPVQPPINGINTYAEPTASQQDNSPVSMPHRNLSERLHDKTATLGNNVGVTFSKILSMSGHKALEQAAEEVLQDNTVHFLG